MKQYAVVVALTLCSAVAETQPPGIRNSTWVREDLFAGFLASDWARFESGEKKLEDILARTPNAPDALAWKAGARLMRAVAAHEQGKSAEFEKLYSESRAILDQARIAAGETAAREAVYAIAGGTYVVFADRLPAPLRRTAWERAYNEYSALQRMQAEFFDKLPLHMRGEVLGGLAQAAQRLGREEESQKRIADLIQSLPNSQYAARAERWRSNPALAEKVNLTCLTCHEPGRLQAMLSATQSNQ
jgi:hypothetical protein